MEVDGSGAVAAASTEQRTTNWRDETHGGTGHRVIFMSEINGTAYSWLARWQFGYPILRSTVQGSVYPVITTRRP